MVVDAGNVSLSGIGHVPTALWNDARVAEEAPLLRVQSCKRLVSSNLTHSLHNRVAIVSHCNA